MAMDARARIRVFGRVQGVFFRHNASVVASRLGLVGYVENREDGSVEIVCEGDRKAVEDMIEWAKKGPAHAVVTSYRVTWEIPTGEFDGFDVSH